MRFQEPRQVAQDEFPNLDVLRAVAVLAVYFVHLLIVIGLLSPEARAVSPLAQHVYKAGGFGVLIFFVHTSLVLMMSLARLEQSGQPIFMAFYIRRAFRIYPLSIVCVALILLFRLPPAPWLPWTDPSLSTVLANLFLCMNLFYEEPITAVLWSLPYEVEMYVLLPMLYLVGKVYGLRAILVLWAVSIAVAIVQPQLVGRLDIAKFVPCFMAGVASYFLGFGTIQRRLPFIGWPIVIAAAAGIYCYGVALGFQTAASWAMCMTIGLAAPLFVELNFSPLKKLAAWIARYSYGIYLTHLYAQWTAFVVLKDQALLIRYLALIALSIGVPVLLYHIVEVPMIRFGARLAKRLQARQPSSATPGIGVVWGIPGLKHLRPAMFARKPAVCHRGRSSASGRGVA